MDPARPSNPTNYLTLQQAAEILAVSIEVLLSWNDNNILKPTITPTGDIGYSELQINQFLKIQNSSQLTVNRNFLEKPSDSTISKQPYEIVNQKNALNYDNQQTNNFSQINNYNFYNPPTDPAKKNKIVISLIGIAAGFSFFITASILILFSENKLNTLVHQNEENNLNSSSVLAADTSNNNLQKSGNSNGSNQSLSNEGVSVAQNRIASINRPSENKAVYASSAAKTSQKQIAVAGAIIQSQKVDDLGSNIMPDSSSSYNQKANVEENSDTKNEVFDTEGNIKVSKTEAEENRIIATRLSMGGINQNQGQIIKQNTSSVTLVSLLILGTSMIYVLYSRKRQFLPVLGNSQNLDIQPQNIATINPKIIEIFQKTDGTVMMFFQGREIKISKPELDSESDKFIERLMQLVGGDIKEIEYDSLLDENLSISTPLSKLVTRLGFVGIKRDLFFPRTSKTRVHFRKNLTADDLLSMNLTPDDVINGFLLNN